MKGIKSFIRKGVFVVPYKAQLKNNVQKSSQDRQASALAKEPL